jgi:hypothetical protein
MTSKIGEKCSTHREMRTGYKIYLDNVKKGNPFEISKHRWG